MSQHKKEIYDNVKQKWKMNAWVEAAWGRPNCVKMNQISTLLPNVIVLVIESMKAWRHEKS